MTRLPSPTGERYDVIRDLGLPFNVCIGLLGVSIGVVLGCFTDLYNLVAVITALLLTACWHAWGLLVEG